MGIGVALLVAMLFGLNAWLAFISVFTNPLSIIIAVIALVTFSILLVIANITNTFKLGKLFDYERYKEYSLFNLRESTSVVNNLDSIHTKLKIKANNGKN